jgi:hypothetical protein
MLAAKIAGTSWVGRMEVSFETEIGSCRGHEKEACEKRANLKNLSLINGLWLPVNEIGREMLSYTTLEAYPLLQCLGQL